MALNANENKGMTEMERSLQEALQIVDEGLETNDVQQMKLALALLQEELPFHPEYLPKLEKGNVDLTRAHIETLLNEGHESLSANDKLKNLLQEVRSRIEVNLMSLRPATKNFKTETEDWPNLDNLLKQVPKQAEVKEGVKETITEAPTEVETLLVKMMPGLLEESGRFNLDSQKGNAPSRALVKMMKEAGLKEADVSRWKAFLQKPNAYLSKEAGAFVDKPAAELQNLISQTNQEIAETNDEITRNTENFRILAGNIRTDMTTERLKLQEEKQKLLKQKREAEAKKSNLEAALQYKKGAVRYKSVEQVMCMTQLFLANEKGEDMPSEADVYRGIEKRVAAERGNKKTRNMRSELGRLQSTRSEYERRLKTETDPQKKTKLQERVARLQEEESKLEARITEENEREMSQMSLLKPSLEATLLILGEKSPYLKQVGVAKMKELAKAWDDKAKVDLWIKGLQLSDGDRKKVVASLIAYLNMAKNENMVSNVKFISEGHLIRLIKHIEGLRHEYAEEKMKTVPETASDAMKLKAYSDEMAAMTLQEEELHQDYLRRTGWEKTQKAGKIAAAAGAFGLGALWAGMKLGGKGLKHFHGWKGENKARVLCTGILGAGATYAGLALTPIAAIALPGVIAPELWKKRKEIAQGTGKVVGETAKFGGRSLAYAAKLSLFPLTGGLSVFSKKWWRSLGKWKVFEGKAANTSTPNSNKNAA